jgi:4-carboxymuconolactone decarboxylase
VSRIADVKYEEMDAEQQRVHDRIASGPRGGVRGPLRVWLRTPVLADRLQSLGEYCRYDTSLEPRLSELAIIVTASVWRAGYEWTAHAPKALEAGVDAAAIEAIRKGERPLLLRDDEAAVYDVATELHEKRMLSEATYERASAILGEIALIELVAVLGYYATISMTINAFAIDGPSDTPSPFSR